MDKVMVIGGPGNISSSTISELVDRKFAVALFSKPGSNFQEVDHKVKIYHGDRSNQQTLDQAISSFCPDYIIDMACFDPEHANQIAKLVKGKLRQYIFVSTVDVYGFPLSRIPMKESNTWKDVPNSTYAQNKKLCESVFNSMASGSGFPLTIVRPGYSFNNRFLISALSRSAASEILSRIKLLKPILVPGDGRTLIHVSSGYNTGRMVARVLGEDRAIGNHYTLAHPDPMEYIDYLRLIAQAVGEEPVFEFIPSEWILSQNLPELKGNLLEELCQYNLNFSVDKFLCDFPDFEYEPLSNAMQRVVRWQLENNDLTFRPSIQDQLILDYQNCVRKFYVE